MNVTDDYLKEIAEKEAIKLLIEEIDKCKDHGWKHEGIKHSDYGIIDYIYQCKYLDYKNGCNCIISKDGKKCSDFIEEGHINPTRLGKILGFKPKTYIKKCKYFLVMRGKEIKGYAPPYLDEGDKNIYNYRNSLINKLNS